MELKIYRAIIGLAVVIGIGYAIFWNVSPQIDEQYLESTIPAELQNQVFHWRYDVGWDFRVEIGEDEIYWEGLEEPFEGWLETVDPHITKVGENLYFATWLVPTANGFDSLVIDFENSRVYAHSKGNSKFAEISGEIYCDGRVDECVPPRRN